MNLYVSALIVFSLLLSVRAKPGESVILTGREKSVFSIFQADMKAYPEFYADEDINAYYEEFKTLNNLEGRKLKKGEELIFPHTEKSKTIQEAETAKAAEAANATAQTKRAARRARNQAASGEVSAYPSENTVSLFGSDKRSYTTIPSRETEIAHAEAERKDARHTAINYFQHALLPQWLYSDLKIVETLEKGNIETLVAKAQEVVDEQFAKALVLHRYPDKGVYVLGFEPPVKVGDFFFLGIKKKTSGGLYLYTLEKGISFFGAGNKSILYEWESADSFSELGGMELTDLASFLQVLEAERPLSSENE